VQLVLTDVSCHSQDKHHPTLLLHPQAINMATSRSKEEHPRRIARQITDHTIQAFIFFFFFFLWVREVALRPTHTGPVPHHPARPAL